MHEDFSAIIDKVRPAQVWARRRLVLAAAMVVRWFMDLDVIFIMFEVLCTSGEFLYNRYDSFHKKTQST